MSEVHKIKRAKKIMIDLDDVEYTLSVPSLEQMKPLFSLDKDDPVKVIESQKGLLCAMGLPEDVVGTLGFFEANQLMEVLTGNFQKKI